MGDSSSDSGADVVLNKPSDMCHRPILVVSSTPPALSNLNTSTSPFSQPLSPQSRLHHPHHPMQGHYHHHLHHHHLQLSQVLPTKTLSTQSHTQQYQSIFSICSIGVLGHITTFCFWKSDKHKLLLRDQWATWPIKHCYDLIKPVCIFFYVSSTNTTMILRL